MILLGGDGAQIILRALTPVEQEPKAEERYLFDLVASALVAPHILHHKQHTIKQAVLACLREIVRIVALGSTSPEGSSEFSPTSSARARYKVRPCPPPPSPPSSP
jgi:hypothetical protein